MRNYYWTKQPFGEDGRLFTRRAPLGRGQGTELRCQKGHCADLDNSGRRWRDRPARGALDNPMAKPFSILRTHAEGIGQARRHPGDRLENNLADALEVFEKNRDMVLSLDDFAAYEINWEPRERRSPDGGSLRLGLDSFVFFDDNPAEREQVRQVLPEVEVVDVPEDPAEYVRVLERALYFEAIALTDEDRQCSEQYVDLQVAGA